MAKEEFLWDLEGFPKPHRDAVMSLRHTDYRAQTLYHVLVSMPAEWDYCDFVERVADAQVDPAFVRALFRARYGEDEGSEPDEWSVGDEIDEDDDPTYH